MTVNRVWPSSPTSFHSPPRNRSITRFSNRCSLSGKRAPKR
ncbi:MAG: hypothetical protein JNK90_14130 [Planctomycetaceae bacterium]|nr:hypothetical protein [Planctomycetaceae bacterium]MBN8600936.1 hypothetical protein [Planctomycetota bacterium]